MEKQVEPRMEHRLFADVGFCSLNKSGEELCGDKVHITRTPDSAVVVLADGLGSGVKANILATLTSKIAGDMLRMGSDIEEVVDTLTETLPVCKVRGVAYSTFTIFQMFSDGRAYLVEYDNPGTFFFRQGKAEQLYYLERTVNGKAIKESRFRVSEGDTLVMVSDGAVHAGVGQILNLGWQWPQILEHLGRTVPVCKTPEEVARQLADACGELYCHKPGDDTTTVAVRFKMSSPLTLLVGPPSIRAMDGAVVQEWMDQPGRKVVCGGTSANLVARELGLELTVNLADRAADPDVPPTAVIEGIDLVTEGVLTLRKVLALLQEYRLDPGADLPQGRSGAHKLATLLLRDATEIHFMVGTAINPAHQNPNFPQDLNIKLRIVHDIIRLLRELDKPTSITLY
ncbi:SpoIIE family protein phosphatase [Gorillibacterium sp. sgz5001074]|uniref:SpoIIE family protein phosphatase n=1 Tax=Gorillibacterium sp. sgz5001074 TaxID=3446695 RepID=UPI003F67C022